MLYRVSRFLLAPALVGGVTLAQVPPTDSRNTKIDGLETHYSMPEYKTRADWEQRKAHLRRQILFASGLDPMPEKTPLHAQVFDRVDSQNCTIEKVLLETLPGNYLGGNLYRPKNNPGKHPAVLNPHGHWTYGRLENQPLDSGPEFGMNLARQGYVAFLWDMVGYNDTLQLPHAFGSPVEQLWGFGPFGMQLWNAIRALDFVASLDDVDPQQIGVAGASGGGTQTFTLAAVDDRVAFDAPVSMVSAIYAGGDFCENAPGLRVRANNLEIAAMMAPKPMLLVAATGDWTKNTMTEEFPAIRKIYELYGKPENIDAAIFDAPHNFAKPAREAVYKFFGKHVLNLADAKKTAERNEKVEMQQNMLALANRKLPDNALTYPQIFAQWQSASKRQVDEITSHDVLRQRLQIALASEWPSEVVSQVNGEAIVLSRSPRGDRIPGVWITGHGVPAVVVHPAGSVAARQDPAAAALLKSGRPVLLIDAFQTGLAAAPRDRSSKIFLSFNQSDDACRVQDILTALAFAHQKFSGPIELVGIGKAGVWAEFAAAVAPIPVKLHVDKGAFHGDDDEFVKDFNVPLIQRAGGFGAAERLTSSLR
jgi:dienelactone hydrolase